MQASAPRRTLRTWREDFAAYLRELGVAANATPAQLRGKPRAHHRDGIHRAVRRGQSTFLRRKVERIAQELLRGGLTPEPGKAKLVATRNSIEKDWRATAAVLRGQGQPSLGREVERYIGQMRPVATDKELLAKGLAAQWAAQRSGIAVPKLEQSMGKRAR